MDSTSYISKKFKDNEVIRTWDYQIAPDSNWNKHKVCVIMNLELTRYLLLKNCCSYFRCGGGIVVMFQEKTLLLTNTP